MAFSHIINCILLTYGPYFVAYRAKSIPENGAVKICIFAALACLITSAVKMIIIASFFSTGFETNSFDLSMEVQKNIFNLIDYLGIFVALKYRWSFTDNQSVRITAFTIGWSFFESLCSNFFYFIFSANSDEFSWKHILRAVSSNLDIVDTFCAVAMIVALSNNVKSGGRFSLANIFIGLVLLAKATILPIYTSHLSFLHPNSENNQEQVIAKAVFSLSLLFLTIFGRFL